MSLVDFVLDLGFWFGDILTPNILPIEKILITMSHHLSSDWNHFYLLYIGDSTTQLPSLITMVIVSPLRIGLVGTPSKWPFLACK